MRIDEIHNKIDMVCEKQRVGFFNPERKDIALDMASLQYFSRSLPEYGSTEVMNECLTPFKRKLVVTNSNSPGGLVSLPAEYEFLTNIIKVGFDNNRQVNTYNGIEVVNDDELADRLKSQLIPLTVLKPVAQRIAITDPLGSGITIHQVQLYPTVPNVLTINYLKRPQYPVYGYDPDPADPDGIAILYNNATSKQLEWKETDIYKIICGAISILGINLENDKLVQYGLLENKVNP